MEGLADIYDEDLCEAVGVSNYGPIQLTKFSQRMKEEGYVPLVQLLRHAKRQLS